MGKIRQTNINKIKCLKRFKRNSDSSVHGLCLVLQLIHNQVNMVELQCQTQPIDKSSVVSRVTREGRKKKANIFSDP